jgi:sulfate transport system ATP-binding protein
VRRATRHRVPARFLQSIFVTHDQEEALELADRIVVMDHGRIEQVGTPEEVYMQPASAFVADFVGESNRVPVQVTGGRVLLAGQDSGVPATDHPTDGAVELHFRPHDVALRAEGEAGIPFTVIDVFRKGGSWRVEGSIAGHDGMIEADVDAATAPPAAGQRFALVPTRPRLFPAR